MWLQRIRAEKRKVEDETGYRPDYLIVRPELMEPLCAETENCPFGMLESLDGMIVSASDLLVDEFSFGVNAYKIEVQ
jgi:hypothetical protein